MNKEYHSIFEDLLLPPKEALLTVWKVIWWNIWKNPQYIFACMVFYATLVSSTKKEDPVRHFKYQYQQKTEPIFDCQVSASWIKLFKYIFGFRDHYTNQIPNVDIWNNIFANEYNIVRCFIGWDNKIFVVKFRQGIYHIRLLHVAFHILLQCTHDCLDFHDHKNTYVNNI